MKVVGVVATGLVLLIFARFIIFIIGMAFVLALIFGVACLIIAGIASLFEDDRPMVNNPPTPGTNAARAQESAALRIQLDKEYKEKQAGKAVAETAALLPPLGWYKDPSDTTNTRYRFWDGAQWTEKVDG